MNSAPARMTLPDLAETLTVCRGPDPVAVRAIHRHEEGFVTLASKKGGRYRDLCAIPAKQLQQLLPLFADELQEDSYFSIHGMAVAGRQSVTLAGVEYLAWSTRNGNYADYLTCAFVDCDCYTANLTAGEALGRLVDAENNGTLPPVSVYLLSGRGVWACWLLGDESGRVPKTGDSERRLWAGIERELCNRVRGFGIGLDEGCIDLARVCRLPGSINSKADEEVRFLWQTDQGQTVSAYTIDTLADLLGVRSWIPRVIVGEAGAKPGRARGWRALWQKRLEKLDALALLRGGCWKEGHRNYALFLLALCLRKSGNPDRIVRDAVERAGILSGLSVGESRAVVRDLSRLDKYTKISDEKIHLWLGINEKEADAIGWAAPSKYWSQQERSQRRANKTVRIDARRSLVAEYVRTSGNEHWTLRALQTWLNDKHGFRPGFDALRKDLVALGIETPTQAQNTDTLLLFGSA